MARKKQPKRENTPKMQGFIAGAGEIQAQDINDTLRQNYMPYAMSVIMSRAIPEIDGFKPSHRKLLYTMYKMNLLGSARTKSANIVGQTMKLNPHGDSAIYDTMVRLSRGYEALLHPYVDSKGNFGKFYSRDMAWAASRYTEARLDPICRELFRDIDKDTVDFVDNYDSTMKEPTLLPAAFPSVLVNANTGIAVGMASSICPFNLAEVCTTAAELIRDPKHDIFTTMQAPDFPGGGQIIFDRAAMEQIYKTGRGSIKVRSRYTYDKSANCIDITQIPPTTTIEAIVEKVIDLVKQGKVKEITDIRDETGLDGLKITIDLKRGADPDKLMQRLFRMTTLEKTSVDQLTKAVGIAKGSFYKFFESKEMAFFAVLESIHSELYGVADHALSEANGLPPSERAAKAVLAVCRRLSDTGDMVFIENDAKLLLQRLPEDVKNVHYHDDETHIRLLLEKYGLVPKRGISLAAATVRGLILTVSHKEQIGGLYPQVLETLVYGACRELFK